MCVCMGGGCGGSGDGCGGRGDRGMCFILLRVKRVREVVNVTERTNPNTPIIILHWGSKYWTSPVSETKSVTVTLQMS